MPLLMWGHAALAGAALLLRFTPPGVADKAVRFLCGLGVALGVGLFIERDSAVAWRSTIVDPEGAAVAGIAVAVAWTIAAVLLDDDDRWRAAVLVGVGASGLVLFASTRWIVPALLFWSITSLAAGALALSLRSPGEMWLGIVLSDLCLAAGLIGHAFENDVWRLEFPLPDRAFWFLLAAAILRVGAFPRFGIWRALGTPAAAGLPLLVGGGFVLAAGAAGRPEPWAAVGLLVLALAQAIWNAVRRDLASTDLAGWPTAIALALVYVVSGVAALAGVAALLAVGVLAVWPLASGSAQPERGLLLTLAPPTAIFGALVFAATHAFEISTNLDASLESAPWIGVTALIPLVMASGALLAGRIGRERSSAPLSWWPAGATWLFVAASVVLGFIPGSLELPDDVVGTQRDYLILLSVALVIGVVSGWLWNLRHPDHRRTPAPEPSVRLVGPPTTQEAVAYRRVGTSLLQRMVAVLALGLSVATFAAIGWITYEGLSQGFL